MPSNILNSQDIALIDSLSESDLKSKLKDSIILLKEKERDLNIAAEIGQKLVEANNKLQKQQGSADDSASLMAMITNLKHQNLDLKSQLETSLAKNQKSKNQSNEQTNKSDHDQEETDSTILSLRKSNNQLQSEVLKLLKNLREREKTHNNTIQSFKSELQNLRKELDESSAYAQSLEQLKNKLIKEKLAAIKESKLMEVAGVSEEKKNSTTLSRDASPKKDVSFSSQDSNTIQTIKTLESKLESQIEQNRALENTLQETLASNAQLESLKITQTELINNIQTQYDDLKNEISNESASFIEGLQKEIEDLQGLIGDLREELELERFKTQFDLNDSPPIIGKTIDNETVSTAAEWQWTSWMDNNWGQIWEKNITTLRNEITVLAENSTTTIESIRVQLDEIITPVKILGEKIGSIASGNEPPVSLLDEGRGRLVIANADVEE